MLKERKIELQSRMINRLQDENIRLRNENNELRYKIQEQSWLVKAAEKYRDEHKKALFVLNKAKEKYSEAIKDVVTEKKRYRKNMKLI